MQTLIPPGEDGIKLNNFDAMRMGLSLAVVYSHAYSFYYGSEARELFHVATNGGRTAGGLAVQCFFILSGFLILHSYQRSKSLGDYFLKRVRRIHPGFIAAILVCGLLIVPAFSREGWAIVTPQYLLNITGNSLLLRSTLPGDVAFMGNPFPGAVNGSLWSIPFEFWCYVGLAALGVTRVLRSRWTLVGLFVAVVATRVFLDLTGRKPGGGIIGVIIGWPYLWFAVLPCFLLGMIVYLFRDEIPRSRWLLGASIVIPFAVAWGFGKEWMITAVSPTCMAYVLFHVAFSNRIRLQEFGRYGDFSYGTYLDAFPLQQGLMALTLGKISFAVYLLLCLVISPIAGMLSWFLVERRFLPRSRRHHAVKPDPALTNPTA